MRSCLVVSAILCINTVALGAQPSAESRAPSIEGNRYWVSPDRRDTVRYRDPADAAVLGDLTQRVNDARLVDSVLARASAKVGLEGLSVVFRPCGTANAFYYARTDRIVLCAELLRDFARLMRAEGSSDALAVSMDALRFTAAHEIGHAVIARYQLPITGDEEIAADEFAAWLLDQSGEKAELINTDVLFIAQALHEDVTYSQAVEAHGLAGQRQARLHCWVIVLPDYQSEDAERLGKCLASTARAQRTWTTLLAPYRPPGATAQ